MPFETICDIPTHLIAFSDDMDGLRKVPDNLPQQEMLAARLGQPLTAIPDPFGTHESFGHHIECAAARLSGPVRLSLRILFLDRHLQIGPVRRGAAEASCELRQGDGGDAAHPGRGTPADLFAVLPVSPRSGKVLLAKVVDRDVAKGTITYVEEDAVMRPCR